LKRIKIFIKKLINEIEKLIALLILLIMGISKEFNKDFDEIIDYFRNAIYDVKFPSCELWFSCGITSFNVYSPKMYNVTFRLKNPSNQHYRELILIINSKLKTLEVLYNNIPELSITKGDKINYSDITIKKKSQYENFD